MNKPKIGDTVHYVSYGTPGGEYPSVCRAAIVAAVDEYQTSEPGSFLGHASLTVLNPEGMFFNRSVLPSDEHKGGTWHSRENCPN